MIDKLRFELSFKNIDQLERKINFCKSNRINNINIPCKGVIKSDFLNATFEYINEKHKDLNVVYHYSLYHQYSKNRQESYEKFIYFIKQCNLKEKRYEILLISGSKKRKNFDVVNVLNDLKSYKNLKPKLGIAYNPYFHYYDRLYSERERFIDKISSGLVKSIWLQFGTDIKILESELNFLRKNCNDRIKIYGSLLIPSKQFIARFNFRPWKEVYISKKYLNSLDYFQDFTKDLIRFYVENDIKPLIETDFSNSDKLDYIYNLFDDC